MNVALLAFIVLALAAFANSGSAVDMPSVKWSKTINGLHASSVIQTSDGGYAIAGVSWSGGGTLVKTDASGDVQWQKSVGDAVSLAQAADSGYVLFCAGNTIVKTDSEGNVQSSFAVGNVGEMIREGIVTSDGNYVLVGKGVGIDGDYAWLYKVDPQGNLMWNKKFTGGSFVDAGAVTETINHGCVLAGSWNKDFWLVYIDSNGNEQWKETYPHGGTYDAHLVSSIISTIDGGYLIAGKGDWQEAGGLVPWLVKINSQGREQWGLPYGNYPQDGFSSVVQADDQGYVLAFGNNGYLLKTDTSGSEQWTLPHSIVNGSSSIIRTRDGGYVIAQGNSADATQLVKLSYAISSAPVVTISSPRSGTYDKTDFSLTVTVNEPVSWIGYSLDGQDNVTTAGNATLVGLAVGEHELIVYAKNAEGVIGASQVIHFTVTARFPTELAIIGVTVGAVAAVVVLLYFKRDSLAVYRQKGLTSFFRRNIGKVTGNRIVWTLSIIVLCILLVFVQLFFPYFYYSSATRNSNSQFEVGISYVYERDNIRQIPEEIARIQGLGITVVRVNLVYDSLILSDYANTQTEVFFNSIQQTNLRVALIINNHDSVDDIDYYLRRWGQKLTYVQILNEPDVASSWTIGALFTDDEAGSKFDQVYSIVEEHQLPAKRYTNFGPAFVARTNLPVEFSEKLDFVGFDVFMESLLTVSPSMIQLLHKITNKEIVIAEFGMSTSDDEAQSDYVIRGLNLFKSMGLRGCWLVYWNSVNNNYGIRGRLSEQRIGEWIAQNT